MKKILIVSGLHGDEIPSVLTAYEIKEWVDKNNIKNVVVIPRLNKRAYCQGLRCDPEDNKDLNRIFPGNKNGSISEKIAYNFFKYCKKFDIVIDLHTYSHGRECIPFILGDLNWKDVLNLSYKIGLKYAVQSSCTRGQLFTELSKIGIPSIIIESGSADKTNRKSIEAVKNALINFIKNKNNEKPKIIKKYKKVKIKFYGNFKKNVSIGDYVKKGEIIARINKKNIKSNEDGFIIGLFSKDKYSKEDGYLFAIGSVN